MSDDGVIGEGMTTNRVPAESTTTKPTEDKTTEEPTTETPSREEETSDGMENSQVEKKTVSSDTGTGINLVVEYSVGEKTNGERKITVDVYIEHYSLNVTSRTNTNYVRVGDETFYFSTDAISYDGTEKKMTKVATHTFTTTTDNGTLPIYALWNFNGVYSDKPISAIIVENNIQL